MSSSAHSIVSHRLPATEQVVEDGQKVGHLVFAPDAGSTVGGERPNLSRAFLGDGASLIEDLPPLLWREVGGDEF
jgi:hypothetical protein